MSGMLKYPVVTNEGLKIAIKSTRKIEQFT
jgi:hypothetical protein